MTDLTEILSWDYKDQPNLNRLGEAIWRVSEGAVCMREVPDTGGDCYAVVIVPSLALTDMDAQMLYDNYEES